MSHSKQIKTDFQLLPEAAKLIFERFFFPFLK